MLSLIGVVYDFTPGGLVGGEFREQHPIHKGGGSAKDPSRSGVLPHVSSPHLAVVGVSICVYTHDIVIGERWELGGDLGGPSLLDFLLGLVSAGEDILLINQSEVQVLIILASRSISKALIKHQWHQLVRHPGLMVVR